MVSGPRSSAITLLTSSFVLLDRVTLAGEQRLWSAGITEWRSFRAASKIPGFGKRRKLYSDLQLAELERALEAGLRTGRFDTLAERLPRGEHWRLLPLFDDGIAYLDIETAERYGDVTVLGVWDGSEYVAFVKGRNLDKELVKQYLGRFTVFVTFNGSSFDLPIIERYFRGVLPERHLHVDLRHVCARLGLHGGLKSVETVLGITRHEDVRGMCGAEAALLWHEYLLTRDDELVELLLEYNEADCKNLEPLAGVVVPALWRQLRALSLEEPLLVLSESGQTQPL